MFSHNQNSEKPITVLLVDGQKLSRKCIRSVLENVPFISLLEEASSGKEAMSISSQTKPVVVLIKDDLDDIKGTELCRTLKKNRGDVRVILMASDDTENRLIHSLAVGAHGFFSLSMDLQKLLKAIVIVAEGDLWIDSNSSTIIQSYAQKLLSFDGNGTPILRESLKDALTSREMEVLSLVAEGRSNNDISQELEISLHTTKSHIRNILTKLKVNDRASAADLLKA
ncbi:MAG: response regulator transcription factor [Candidatus Obscuribacterales bacterium]|nr:response regulator transcription factor [Cyanobacteria bacterium HKST-UBA01]MCB9469449.1 response regulator transcription factor [Candidatus Obscuribacterales bacterium]